MFRNLSTGTLSLLILALLGGLVAAYGVRMALIKEETPEPPAPNIINLPVASADLPEGRQVVLGDVSLIPMTYDQLEREGWANQRVMRAPEQVMGRLLKRPLVQGMPFLTTDFYLDGTGPVLTSLLKPGFRSVSVKVPFDRGGYVTPGSLVDVLFRTLPRPASDGVAAIPESTRILVEGVEVLGVERDMTTSDGRMPAARKLDLRNNNRRQRDMEIPLTVVLAVTPADANRIEAVREKGEVSLVTLPPGEVRIARKSPPVTLEDVLDIDPPLPVREVVEPPPFRTEIYRRGSRSVNEFPPQEALPAQDNAAAPVESPAPNSA